MVKRDAHSNIATQLLRLRLGLTAAAKHFNSSAEDHGRVGVQLALFELDFFLRGLFGTQHASIFMPLNQLRYALIDLDRGKVVPLLTPKKTKNRPKDSSAKEALRSSAAVAMELFMKGKVQRKQAARNVAKRLSEMGYEHSPGKQISAKHVEDWRDRMMTERPSEFEPAGRFHRLVPQLELRFRDNPLAAATYLLQQIAATAPPDIPKKPPS